MKMSARWEHFLKDLFKKKKKVCICLAPRLNIIFHGSYKADEILNGLREEGVQLGQGGGI